MRSVIFEESEQRAMAFSTASAGLFVGAGGRILLPRNLPRCALVFAPRAQRARHLDRRRTRQRLLRQAYGSVVRLGTRLNLPGLQRELGLYFNDRLRSQQSLPQLK